MPSAPVRAAGPSTTAAVAYPLSPLRRPSAAAAASTLSPVQNPSYQHRPSIVNIDALLATRGDDYCDDNDDDNDIAVVDTDSPEPTPDSNSNSSPNSPLHPSHADDSVGRPPHPAHLRTSSRGRKQSSFTRQEYINAIYKHSLRSPLTSTFPGHNYIGIANWLLLPHNPSTGSTNHDAAATGDDNHWLAALHQLGGHEPSRTQLLAQGEVSALETLLQPLGTSKKGSLLFLRGHQPPAWIAELGSRFCIDPEFFTRHLDFFSSTTHRSSFGKPSLVTTDNNIIRVCVTTILTNDPVYAGSHRGFATRHRETRNLLSKYRREFLRSATYGDSVIREYTMLSPNYAVMEQNISICVAPVGDSWIGLVWMDSGRSIDSSPPGPWIADFELNSHRMTETVLPIIQHHQKMAFKRIGDIRVENDSGDAAPSPHGRPPARAPQSSSILPLEYPSLLSTVGLARRASSDVLYALIPIFAHAAFSEVAFLNLLDGLIEELIAPFPIDEFRSDWFERLQEYEVCLERHASQLRHSLRAIRVLQGLGIAARPSPKTTQSQGDIDSRIRVHRTPSQVSREPPTSLEFHLPEASTYTVAGIVEDYDDLLSRCTRLRTRVAACMSTEMNRAMILESRRAIEQSERLKKLTLLATYFIPLTFTASFFGMNFQLFGQGHLALWLYFVIAVPLTLLTHMVSTADLAAWKQRLFRKVNRLVQRKPRTGVGEESS